MSVCVGMDVHRKRSQIAIVDEAGDQQRNRNLANDPAKLVPFLGVLPPGAPVAFEAAYGWAGWSSCWRSWSWNRTWSIPPLQSNRRGPAAGRQGGCGHPGPAAAGRFAGRGLDRPQQVRDLRALLRHRAGLIRLSTGLKNRVHAVLADRGISARSSLWTAPGRTWLAALDLPPIPRAIIQDCCGLLDALATPIARLEGEIGALAKPDPESKHSWPCLVSAG